MTTVGISPERFDSAEAVIRHVSSKDLASHPLIDHIRRSGEAGLLWLLIDNTYRGTSVHFASWLASVTATVEDDRTRCLLARQLNEEMGDGDVSRAHARLMTEFLAGIAPLRPERLAHEWLEPGDALGRTLEQHYRSTDQYEALSTLMAGEVCAHQLIASVGALLQPHLSKIDRSKLTWLTHHNEVEGDHADESLALAAFVPDSPEPIRSVVKGAFGLHGALWRSMDDLLERWSTQN
jgi:pyrroloquinoline quinone (PQQ) biosynthesis protein C